MNTIMNIISALNKDLETELLNDDLAAEIKNGLEKVQKGLFDARNDILQMLEKSKEYKKNFELNTDDVFVLEEYLESKAKFVFSTLRTVDYESCDQDYLMGALSVYRMVLACWSDALTLDQCSDDFWVAIRALLRMANKFSGRKPDAFRQKVRDFALESKRELLQRGKSNRVANAIVIDRLEHHPIYGEYVKGLGKEALRKLFQMPKTGKERNGK